MVQKISTSPLILSGASNVDFAHSCAFNCTTRYIPLWTNLLNFQTPSPNLFNSVAAPDQRATSFLLAPAENQAIKATCRVIYVDVHSSYV
uniref:Uncharacterized protein n=1 Tax=Romanomermis culicivorax TaxID=13658 RepID=A0A915KGX4_ROMCU